MSSELDEIRAFRVTDDKVDELSRQAARAVLVAHINATLEQPPHGPRSRPRGVSRITTRLLAAAVPILVAVAVAAVVLLAARPGTRQPAAGPEARGRQPLISIVGVLRRRQTQADRSFDQRGWPEPPRAPGSQIEPDRPLVRLATVTPWGAKVFLVPLTRPTNRVLASELGETVTLWVQGIGWSDYSTLAGLSAGDAWGPQAIARLPSGELVSRYFEVVPDGVSRVVVRNPVSLNPLRFRGQETAIVHDNIAVFQVRSPELQAVFATWYAANGRVIKRVGDWNLANLPRVSSPTCRTSQLKIRIGHSSAAADTVGAYIEFINRSRRGCQLSGWPTLVGITTSRESSRAADVPGPEVGANVNGVPTVNLKPRRRADAVFAGSDNPRSGSSCGPAYRRLRVTPPGSSQSVVISAWIPYFNGFLPSCSQIRASPIVPSADLYKR